MRRRILLFLLPALLVAQIITVVGPTIEAHAQLDNTLRKKYLVAKLLNSCFQQLNQLESWVPLGGNTASSLKADAFTYTAGNYDCDKGDSTVYNPGINSLVNDLAPGVSAADFFTAIGYKQEQGGFRRSGSIDDLKNAVAKKYNNGTIPSLNDADVKYAAAIIDYESYCQPSSVDTSGLSSTEKTALTQAASGSHSYGGKYYYNVNYIQNGKVTPTLVTTKSYCNPQVSILNSATDAYVGSVDTANDQASYDAFITKLQESLCKKPAANAGATAQDAYAKCAAGVKANYESCLMSATKADLEKAGIPYEGNEPTLGPTGGSNSSVNKCLADKYGVTPKTVEDALIAAKTSADSAAKTTAASSSPSSTNENPDQPECAVPKIGWVICPAVEWLANVSDSAKGILDGLLVVNAKSMFANGGAGSVKPYWETMRNYANIIFIIGFLVVIYSQITGAGLSNYGIKTLLPKLIIVAILVNISFILCGIAVDVSNLLGSSAQNLVEGAANGSKMDINYSPLMTSDGGFVKLAAQILSGFLLLGVVGYFFLGAVISMLIFIVITAVTMVFVLGLRQALIIILVVLSPLAFVAMLLPNTKKLFDKWWGTFKSLLLIYPIVGLLYGAGKLSSIILKANAAGLGDGEKTQQFLIQIIAGFLLFAPLLATYVVLKKTLSSFGAVGGAVAKIQGKTAGALNGHAQKRLGESRYGQSKAYFERQGARKRAMVRAGTYKDTGRFRRVNPRNLARILNRKVNDSKWSGRAGDKLANAGAMIEQQNLEEDKKEAAANISRANLTHDERQSIVDGQTVKGISGKSLAARMAAQEAIVATGDSQQMNRLVDHAHTNLDTKTSEGAAQLNHLADTIQRSSNKPAYIQPGDLENMRHHGESDKSGNPIVMGSSSDMIRSALGANVYSPEKQAATGRQEMGIVRAELEKINNETGGTYEYKDASGNVTESHLASAQNYINNAHRAINDPQLSRQLGKQREMVEHSARADFRPV